MRSIFNYVCLFCGSRHKSGHGSKFGEILSIFTADSYRNTVAKRKTGILAYCVGEPLFCTGQGNCAQRGYSIKRYMQFGKGVKILKRFQTADFKTVFAAGKSDANFLIFICVVFRRHFDLVPVA